jgi:hypothetical protein
VSINPSDSISQAHAGSQVSQTRPHVSLLSSIQTRPQARAGSQVSQTRSRVSLLPSIQTQPAIRPKDYPFEVMWSIEDCQKDADVDVKDSNRSRPSMDRAVRRSDGTMVSDSEWSAIKASARRIAYELSALPYSSRQGRMRRTKVYYRTHHPREWTSAIIRLEAEQPVLQLCSSNWKADHVLGNSIQAILSTAAYATKRGKKKQRNKGKEREKVSSDDDSDNGRGGIEASGSKLLIIMNLRVNT